MKVLVIGSGAREHVLAWKLKQSSRVTELFAAPGNPGMAEVAECVDLRVDDLEGIARFARERQIELAVVGPEAPLAAGLADRLREAGIRTFGPSAAAARIESSKAYARELMTRVQAPQPAYATFTEVSEALDYLDELERQGVTAAVVKASGLAAGKGAIICPTLDEARVAVKELMIDAVLGAAGEEVVIEEMLSGEEASLFVLTDGENALPLVPAQDYKRVGDGDEGPNTGGMGSYAPAPVLSPAEVEEVMETIVRPVLRGMAADGTPFQGCLYAGLMKTATGCKVIEFNCRFGDPETQSVLPLLETDLCDLLFACADGNLDQPELAWKPGRVVTVVLASGGYPGKYATGLPIHGLDEVAALDNVWVFHAGTAQKDGQVVTAGGRVLNVTAWGETYADAIRRVYDAVEKVGFEGAHYRRDIAARVQNQ